MRDNDVKIISPDQVTGEILRITKGNAGDAENLRNMCKKINNSPGKAVLVIYKETSKNNGNGTIALSLGILKQWPICISEVGRIELNTGAHIMYWKLTEERVSICEANIRIFSLPFDIPPGLRNLTERQQGRLVGFDVFVGDEEIRSSLKSCGEDENLFWRLIKRLNVQ